MMKPPAFLTIDNPPPSGQWAMVVTPLGHCLGFIDTAGEWRQVRDGSPLKDVQSWYPMDSEQLGAMQSALERDPVRALPDHL